MSKLALDPMCVLSAWEKMGGTAFSSDDVHLDDPSTFNLDLSSWEARLKPLTNPVPSQLETNIFTSLFTPAEMGLSFLPACCTPSLCATGRTETAQVVPLCPSFAGCSMDDCCDIGVVADGAMFQGTHDSHFDDDGSMSMQFCCDMEAVLSASPTTSEAGVVPDASGNPPAHLSHPNCSTATSGSTDSLSTAALASTGPVAGTAVGMLVTPHISQLFPTPSGSVFVPLDHVAEGAASGPQELSVVVKGEPELQAHGLGPCTATQDSQPNPVQPQAAKQAAAPPPPPQPATPARASAAVPAANPSAQPQHAGAAVHIRTRAECLERYRQKKARRLYTKKIRYQLRKINADKRPRIKGRFVKKEELEEFLAAQRVAGNVAGEECDEAYVGDGMVESDYE